jgi:Protein of unknown function (DUF1275)
MPNGSPGGASPWQEVTATLRPRRDSRDGPLPPLLLTLTAVTGLVDAASYLKLGHVFVANMTGNVVFLGFGIAGAGGISTWASLTALGSFLIGGICGGRIGARWAVQRLVKHAVYSWLRSMLPRTGHASLSLVVTVTDGTGDGNTDALKDARQWGGIPETEPADEGVVISSESAAGGSSFNFSALPPPSTT